MEKIHLDVFEKHLKTFDKSINYDGIINLYHSTLKYFINLTDKYLYGVVVSMLVVKSIEKVKKDFEIVLNNPQLIPAAQIIHKYSLYFKNAIIQLENSKHKKSKEIEYFYIIRRYCVEYFMNRAKRWHIDQILDLCKKENIEIRWEHELKPWLYLNIQEKNNFDEEELYMSLERFCKDMLEQNTFYKYKFQLKQQIQNS
jgi:hypothetical protein